jgi:hypothetical protein
MLGGRDVEMDYVLGAEKCGLVFGYWWVIGW